MLYAGQPGNTKRTKLWDEFGYPNNLEFDRYYRAYERNAVAYAAIHKLLDACWTDNPTIIDGEEAKEATKTTEWEKAVTKLLKKHWPKIKDADRRNLVGRYSALLIQFRDGREWSKPVDKMVVARLKDKSIVKLIPAWESQVKPGNFDTDTLSESYGQPVSYNFNEQPVGDDGTYGPVRGVTVHPDRIIILSEGSEDENMLSGVPFLRAGYNKLLDLEKVSGGSAEGFLKNASRQLGIAFDKETRMEALVKAATDAGYKDLGEALNDKVAKMNRGTDAALVMQAGTPSVLSVAAADPKPTWEVTANEFAASIQCPFTILFGQQTGRLASDEDKTDWAKRCNGRRWGFQSTVVENILERFWNLGVIDPPSSGEVTLAWSDLLAPSEKEKIANMQAMATVAKDTQQAFGTPAVDENEIRAVGELEPRKELKTPDPDQKVITDDPLNPADENRNADRTEQQG
nr:anti-CBASS Acb1 family protein [Atlantibacter hermannii]